MFWVSSWAVLAVPVPAAEDSAAALHSRAVAAGRRGDFVPALEILEQLRKQDPANRRFLYDHVLVLSWAGEDKKALELAPLIERAVAPVEVLEALAKAARNRQRFDEAQSLYRTAIRRQPGRLEAAIGLGLTLADARLADQAMELFKDLMKSHSEDPETLFGYAYAAEAKRNYVQALWAYDRILERAPQDPRALRLKILAVGSLGAPHLALDLAKQHPGTLDAGELERLEGDRIAIQTRWGRLPAATPRTRFEETDRALAMMDQAYRGDWSQMDLRIPKHRRLAFDRMVALRDRVRMKEVLELYEQLLEAKMQVPDFALAAAGDACLYEGQAERALAIYRDMAERNPTDFDTRLALFYAYVELDDFTRALQVIDKLAADEAPWLPAGRQRRPNPRKQTAKIAAAYGRALADDLPGAQQRLESMLLIAPESTEVRKELATVYRWRGWAERALPEFEYVRRREPEYIDNRVQLATTQLGLGFYPKAERATEALVQRYPENKPVQRL
ncbi:MAG TPA: tetratricopeptide repeat protein, partial [Gammaproteobacteria bacterium]|nr:tetratricopeptide repeat protein [Gammaproteobacteria bacterium]